MTARSEALVIGGTGPTGPYVVRGLLERGYDVAILHGGEHETTDVPGSVRHIHADPHFRETLIESINGMNFDLVVAQYGRLSVIADVFRGRTARLIAIGAATRHAAATRDPRWGGLGPPVGYTEANLIDETADPLNSTDPRSKLYARMAAAKRDLFAAHHENAYVATYLGYPLMYGPRQPGPRDWSIVRRVLDGRKRFLLPDGGLKIESTIYSENAAQAVLLVVDRPMVAAGKFYIVCDTPAHTVRQRIDFIAGLLGHEFEYVSLPYHLGEASHPMWRYEQHHRLCDSTLIRRELEYREPVRVEDAISRSVEWILAHRPEPNGELERQIGDPFNYPAEDALMDELERAYARIAALPRPVSRYTHQYRHPKQADEVWTTRQRGEGDAGSTDRASPGTPSIDGAVERRALETSRTALED